MPDSVGTVLSFDYGLKFIGVAIGQRITGTCRPLQTIRANTRNARWQAIEQLLREWDPELLVVGLALDQEGGEQETTRQCRNFAQTLASRTGLQIALVDERYTSLEADQSLRQQGVRRKERAEQEHAEAAALILRSYLESHPL